MGQKAIDVHDLPDEDVHLLETLVKLLREKGKHASSGEQENVSFASWPLGVKGALTRKEIYDYL